MPQIRTMTPIAGGEDIVLVQNPDNKALRVTRPLGIYISSTLGSDGAGASAKVASDEVRVLLPNGRRVLLDQSPHDWNEAGATWIARLDERPRSSIFTWRELIDQHSEATEQAGTRTVAIALLAAD